MATLKMSLFQGVFAHGWKSDWENRCAPLPSPSWNQSEDPTVFGDSLRSSPSTVGRAIGKTDVPLFWTIPETNREIQQYSATALLFYLKTCTPVKETLWGTAWKLRDGFCKVGGGGRNLTSFLHISGLIMKTYTYALEIPQNIFFIWVWIALTLTLSIILRVFPNPLFGEPVVSTPDSRGFRHFHGFRDFR